MRYYVEINGVSSLNINGLAIKELPPITKPLMRNMKEEIDGRDGDLITELGYSAYDKQIEIGLYGNFDIDAIIKYFTGEGTITFSNEPDKFYYFKILDQIDYEKLLKFKTATITFHCQPFKYPKSETPIENTLTTLTGSGTDITINDTEPASMEFTYNGNTSQETTTGSNYFYASGYASADTGISVEVIDNNNVKITYSGTSAGYKRGYFYISGLTANTDYSFKATISNSNSSVTQNWLNVKDSNNTLQLYNNGYSSGNIATFNTGENTTVIIALYAVANTSVTNNIATYSNIQLASGSTVGDYEPYTGGIPAPNPSYPMDVHVVTGDNTIEVRGNSNLEGADELYQRMYDYNSSHVSETTDGNIDVIRFNTNSYRPVGTNYEFNMYGGWKENTQYTVRCKVKKENGTNFFLQFLYTDGTNSYTLIAGSTSSYNEIRIVSTAGKTVQRAGFSFGTAGYWLIDKSSWFIGEGNVTTYPEYIGQKYSINLGVENLFDKDNATYKNNYYKNDSGVETSSGASGYLTSYIAVKPNTQYTISGTLRTSNNSCAIYYYDTSKNWISRIIWDSSSPLNNFTFTTPLNCYYIQFQYIMAVFDASTVQIEKGNKVNQYTPFGTTPIELLEIEDYKDIIFKNETTSPYYDNTLDLNAWYLKKEIGKVVLDGEGYYVTNGQDTTYNSFVTGVISNVVSRENALNIYCDKLIAYLGHKPNICRIGTTTGNIVMDFEPSFCEYTTSGIKEKIKEYYDNGNPFIFYYPLATSTFTKITDDTLLGQLEATKLSYISQTNITQTNDDLPFNLDVSMTFLYPLTVNNVGNIYAKPVLEIEGSGNIGVVLNGIQILEIALGDVGKIAIDVPNLEAFNPDDNSLLNRLVTGDYMKLLINEGNNTIAFDGNVTKATLSKYTRWI